MKTVMDVCGLTCPEPLMAFVASARKPEITEMEISCDCEAARDNISRAATSMGWTIESVDASPERILLALKKNA